MIKLKYCLKWQQQQFLTIKPKSEKLTESCSFLFKFLIITELFTDINLNDFYLQITFFFMSQQKL